MAFSDSKLRWYDKDPTVSMAISILRNAKHEQIELISAKIIELGKENNIVENDSTLKKLEKFFARWYDKNENLKEAMEIMKDLPAEKQKEIALEIIDILCAATGRTLSEHAI